MANEREQLSKTQFERARKFFADNELAPPYNHELEELANILGGKRWGEITEAQYADIGRTAIDAHEHGGDVAAGKAAIDAVLKVHDATPAQGSQCDVMEINDLLSHATADRKLATVGDFMYRIEEAFNRGRTLQRKRDEQEMLGPVTDAEWEGHGNWEAGWAIQLTGRHDLDEILAGRRLNKPPAVDPAISEVDKTAEALVMFWAMPTSDEWFTACSAPEDFRVDPDGKRFASAEGVKNLLMRRVEGYRTRLIELPDPAVEAMLPILRDPHLFEGARIDDAARRLLAAVDAARAADKP